MKLLFLILIFLNGKANAAANYDYEYLPFLNEHIKFSAGMSYSKLESNSDIGNYYLLSQANPRIDMSYTSVNYNGYRHQFSASITEELFRPENDTLVIKTSDPRTRVSLSWQPTWVNENKTLTRFFKFGVKNSTVISEIPTVFTVYGDIGDRYSIEGGVGFTWFGLTVSKFPIGMDVEVLYSQTLFDHSQTSVYNGLVYRFGIDFELKKHSVFDGWGLRGFYEYEDLKNAYSHFVDKEVGLTISRDFSF